MRVSAIISGSHCWSVTSTMASPPPNELSFIGVQPLSSANPMPIASQRVPPPSPTTSLRGEPSHSKLFAMPHWRVTAPTPSPPIPKPNAITVSPPKMYRQPLPPRIIATRMPPPRKIMRTWLISWSNWVIAFVSRGITKRPVASMSNSCKSEIHDHVSRLLPKHSEKPRSTPYS